MVNGMTDVTHLGIFDIPMISNIRNLVYIAPTTKEDYLAVLPITKGRKHTRTKIWFT